MADTITSERTAQLLIRHSQTISDMGLQIDTLSRTVDGLVAITEKQNAMLALIAEQVTPVLDSMKDSPIGMLFGMGKD